MGALTELKYKTFESLFEDVKGDLKNYALSNRIEPQTLIKVAQRVTYDLGLRINMVKEAVLDIEHSRCRLPLDFYVMNFAMLCGEYTVTQTLPQGTSIWEVTPEYTTFPDPFPTCVDPAVSSCDPTKMAYDSTKPFCLTQCGTGYQLIQKINTETRTYKYMLPVRFHKSKDLQCDCPNIYWKCADTAYIKDGFIYMNAEDLCGKMYINYEGVLEDSEGNLLVPDHPFLTEYYEYALKDRVMENIFLNANSVQEANIVAKGMELVKSQLRAARNNALSVVNTPDFREMRTVRDLNRKAFYSKFYAPFASYPWDWSQEIYH